MQAGFGQAGGTGQGGIDAVQIEHVAPDQARGFGTAVAPQLRRPGLWLRGVEHRQWQRRWIRLRQVLQQNRLTRQGIERKLAGKRNPPELPIEVIARPGWSAGTA
ncbi:hypothetical protein XPR_4501 [Xanthomonas arboricola pv. pruni MAFF 301420]|uniref:Uncharacterized protein n=2 Tax=Xanthomonas arboricola pv. pruni TaxID=69929 RepID=W4SMV6_9XANT|nr:integrase [Xanthomonas arboricola pv. pruni str. MAFF 311562]GAE57866.1 hypothetical protein XPR_4501 [Xanthomonas arboricola pv. pruni MAFF 301420]GAE58583.1 hypothetical protein XPN_0489 [Xanthomonas arboricola pv. pruni MAFF 301427]